jgi:hypothetical protein
MAEYIERESLEQDIKQYSHARIDNDAIDQMGFQFVEEIISILRIIEKQPTADVVEVKHGGWLVNEMELSEDPPFCGKIVVRKTPLSYRCSLCGRVEEHQEPYCNCGAKMDLKEGAL